MRRAIGVVGLLSGAVAVAGVLGFVWFVTLVAHPVAPPPRADGIVVLTGGADRVETALRLLAAGHADKLLVSGTGGNAELATLAHHAGLDPGPIAAKVTLGRGATSTRGNADETAAWVRDNDIRSLIVVTALYHMPRALAEIARAAPDLTLYPVPVTPSALRGTGPAADLVRLRLMAEEYVKFLAASLDLTALVPARRAEVTPPEHTRQDLPREDRPRADHRHDDDADANRTHDG